MGNGAILRVYLDSFALQTDIRRLLDNLEAGERLDFDDLPPELRNSFKNEFDARGYILSSDGKVGIVDLCSTCDGTAVYKGEECFACEGYSWLESYDGEHWTPYRD